MFINSEADVPHFKRGLLSTVISNELLAEVNSKVIII